MSRAERFDNHNPADIDVKPPTADVRLIIFLERVNRQRQAPFKEFRLGGPGDSYCHPQKPGSIWGTNTSGKPHS